MGREATVGNFKLERLGELCKIMVTLVDHTTLEFSDSYTQDLLESIQATVNELINIINL